MRPNKKLCLDKLKNSITVDTFKRKLGVKEDKSWEDLKSVIKDAQIE